MEGADVVLNIAPSVLVGDRRSFPGCAGAGRAALEPRPSGRWCIGRGRLPSASAPQLRHTGRSCISDQDVDLGWASNGVSSVAAGGVRVNTCQELADWVWGALPRGLPPNLACRSEPYWSIILMTGQDMIPFPPDEYMALVCGALPIPELHNSFQAVGQTLVNMVYEQKMLGEHIRFLDVGCGCGRFARYLLEKPLASYTGFDRHPGMIDWCCREITARAPKYKFLHYSIKNAAYEKMDNHGGDVSATEFRFPFEDDAFDSVLLAAVFTHMLMPEVYNYLQEIRRVLSPHGKVLLSVFVSEDEDRNDGQSFFHNKRNLLNTINMSGFVYNFIVEGHVHEWCVLTRTVELPIEFDANRYLAIHKDVADAGIDPVQHYLTWGYKEKRRLRYKY
jgi:SAM-dependent methyltransferase